MANIFSLPDSFITLCINKLLSAHIIKVCTFQDGRIRYLQQRLDHFYFGE